MTSLPLLTLMIFTPLVFAIFMQLLSYFMVLEKWIIRSISYIAFTIVLLISIYLYYCYDYIAGGMQFIEQYDWFSMSYIIGIDGIALTLLLLSAVLFPLSIIATNDGVNKEYVNLFLLLQTLVMGSFCALDLMLFYIFFEGALIPMFFIILRWGGERRVYAAIKFCLYTLFGSLFMLMAVIYTCTSFGTSNILMLNTILPHLDIVTQRVLWCCFFISFAIKTPMVPFHTWLPDAHVEAPTGGSMILAGVLLKLGCYGFLRFIIPFFPEVSKEFADIVIILSIIAVIYTAAIALVQENIKKLIAYSSVAHMGIVTAGIFSFNTAGLGGAIYQMISHGITSAGLFLCSGILIERSGTKYIKDYGGIVNSMPHLSFALMVLLFGSIGVPLTSGFIGEFLSIYGISHVSLYYALLIATTMVLSAAYMLYLYSRVIFSTGNMVLRDLLCNEALVLWIMLFAVILLGIMPNSILSIYEHAITMMEKTLRPI